MVLEPAQGLDARALRAIAALEREVVGVDGGRLKLEWGVLRSRRGAEVEDLLWWEGERLLGFLGTYSFGSPIELAGMVAPAARRRGIATAMLDHALGLCGRRGHPEALLVVPRSSVGGRSLATGRGGHLDHSEHALVLHGEPTGLGVEPPLILRRATQADVGAVAALLAAGFGRSEDGLAERIGRQGDNSGGDGGSDRSGGDSAGDDSGGDSERSSGDSAGDDSGGDRTIVVEMDGVAVGTLRLTRDGDTGGVYGFVVDPAVQGRGIGRAVLRRVCTQLRAEGAARVALEVEVDNDRALGLYTSVGFVGTSTEDYFRIPTGTV